MPLKYLLDKALKFTGISSLTFPFIVATWLLLLAGRHCGALPYPSETILAETHINAATLTIGWLKGLSEVFIIDSWMAGLLILAGLLIANAKAALWAAIGSLIGMATAFACGCPADEFLLGLWGFSPALTALAVGHVFRPTSDKPGIRWTLIAITATILTVPIQLLVGRLLTPLSLPVLTLPFCIATWFTALFTKKARH